MEERDGIDIAVEKKGKGILGKILRAARILFNIILIVAIILLASSSILFSHESSLIKARSTEILAQNSWQNSSGADVEKDRKLMSFVMSAPSILYPAQINGITGLEFTNTAYYMAIALNCTLGDADSLASVEMQERISEIRKEIAKTEVFYTSNVFPSSGTSKVINELGTVIIEINAEIDKILAEAERLGSSSAEANTIKDNLGDIANLSGERFAEKLADITNKTQVIGTVLGACYIIIWVGIFEILIYALLFIYKKVNSGKTKDNNKEINECTK